MFARHISIPHRFVCVSDDKHAPGYVPIWPMPEVHGRFRERNYVKLGLFGEPGRELGDRLLFSDIDTVIRANIDDLITDDEIKVLWYRERDYLQGAFIQLRGGMLPEVWAAANDQGAVTEAEALHHGTDQAIMSKFLYNRVVRGDVPHWSEDDGFTINDATPINWRVYCAAAWPKPWDKGSPVKPLYYRESM